MKNSKQSVSYSTIPPPPFTYVYKCTNCIFFIEPNDCQVVCRKGLPDLNTINPTSWCLLWTNKSQEKPFEWIFMK